jgi:hypothetical protein
MDEAPATGPFGRSLCVWPLFTPEFRDQASYDKRDHSLEITATARPALLPRSIVERGNSA